MSKIDKFNDDIQKHSFKEFWDYMCAMEKALAGDMVLVLTPATTGSSAAAVTAAIGGAAGKYTRQVKVELKSAAGEVHEWFNGTFAIGVAEVTAGNGVAAIADSATTVELVEGVGTVTIEYTGAWAAADTQTLTVTGGEKLGYAISNKTSVDTLIA